MRKWDPKVRRFFITCPHVGCGDIIHRFNIGQHFSTHTTNIVNTRVFQELTRRIQEISTWTYSQNKVK